MAVDAGSLLLVGLAGVVVLALLRLIRNNLPGKTPPVFEGLPFVGGILKFTKVRHHGASCASRDSPCSQMSHLLLRSTYLARETSL